MKKLFLLLIAIFTVHLCLAQDPIFQSGNRDFDNEALNLAKKYNKELVLSGKQFNLFKSKIEEFLIRREKIEKQLTGKNKLDTFYKLQAHETLEMRDILTQSQFRLYKKVKQNLQPLDKVE